jgi:nitrous oxidase accessory protein NosD
MRLLRRILFTVVILLVALFLTPSAQAVLASRVFVAARSGNDANACNNVATPCQTFAGAITQVVAGGEIIALESGGYGPLTINKAVTVNAPDGIIAFIHPPSGDAITIGAGASDTVILRGLTLNGGAGNGITVNTVGQLFVEHCTITGFVSDGISFSAAGGTLFMRDDDVRECFFGVIVESTGTASRAVIRGSNFVENTTGVYAFSGSIVAVTDSVAVNNADFGFAVSSATHDADMVLDHVQAISNGTGLDVFGGGIPATLRFANSTVTQNETGVSVTGVGASAFGTSPGTNLIAGNTTTDIFPSLGTAITLQ